MTANPPQFIHISPDWCGEHGLARIFGQSGLTVLHHQKGALATELMMARASGRKPPRALREAVLLAGLHRVNSFSRPPLEAWRALDWLMQQFPRARFILTTRDSDAWMLDRLTRDEGIIARCYAHHLDLPEEALPDLWRRDWQDHLAEVEALLGDDPRMIRVDIDRETPAAFQRRLSRLLPGLLVTSAVEGGWLPAEKASLQQRLAAAMDRPRPAAAREDAELVADVAGFCLKGLMPGGAGAEGVSSLYCDWDGGDVVVNRDGKPLPYAAAIAPGSDRRIMMVAPGRDFKWGRAEGIINDILRLGRADPVRIDMQDARRIGGDPSQPPILPVLCYNRREGARNVVLWPLPGQHEIAAPG